MQTGTGLGAWPNQPPPVYQLMAEIRSLVAAGAPVTLLTHAEERLIERNLDMNDVLHGWKIGDIIGPVTAGKHPGEWQCKVVAPVLYPDSTREIGIVTIVVGRSELLVRTVEWEDEN
jgi:hypothetical protein